MNLKHYILVFITTVAALLSISSFAARWEAITGADVEEIYADKTYTGKTKKGGKFIGHFCTDGRGITIIKGEEKPHTWEAVDDDQVCVTDSNGETSCYSFFRNKKKPKKLRAIQVDTRSAYPLTLQEGKPEFCS